jgi:hypothetical protein
MLSSSSRHYRLSAFLAALAWCLPAAALAMIISHGREDADYLSYSEEFVDVHVEMNVPGPDGAPGPGGNGLGTLIAPRWVLTAAHVAENFAPGHRRNRSTGRHFVTIMGKNYQVNRVVLHPDYRRMPSRAADIALVELGEPVSNHRYVELYRTQDEKGQRVVFVGSGYFGTGLTGPIRSDRMLRAATNRVASVDDRILYFRFDPPDSEDATELEGINGPGDSGSGALIERNGRLYIAGVSCCQDFDSTEGLYGVTEIYPRVSYYAEWIDAVISGDQG